MRSGVRAGAVTGARAGAGVRSGVRAKAVAGARAGAGAKVQGPGVRPKDGSRSCRPSVKLSQRSGDSHCRSNANRAGAATAPAAQFRAAAGLR